jgi:hypothetical protein
VCFVHPSIVQVCEAYAAKFGGPAQEPRWASHVTLVLYHTLSAVLIYPPGLRPADACQPCAGSDGPGSHTLAAIQPKAAWVDPAKPASWQQGAERELSPADLPPAELYGMHDLSDSLSDSPDDDFDTSEGELVDFEQFGAFLSSPRTLT